MQTYTLVDDATEENGCLYVLPGSQRFGNLGKEALQQRLAEENVDLDQGLGGAVACTGKAGDVLLFSTYTGMHFLFV